MKLVDYLRKATNHKVKHKNIVQSMFLWHQRQNYNHSNHNRSQTALLLYLYLFVHTGHKCFRSLTCIDFLYSHFIFRHIFVYFSSRPIRDQYILFFDRLQVLFFRTNFTVYLSVCIMLSSVWCLTDIFCVYIIQCTSYL